MVKKFVFLAGAGVGYLLGSKAGREKLMELWKDPKVQETVSHGTEWAKEKAPGLQEKVSEVASTAKDKVSHSTDSGKPASSAGSSAGTGTSSGSGSTGASAPKPAEASGTGSASNGSFTTGGNHSMSPAEVQPEPKKP
ncbi:YtxH domain-containing protein [Arthrobacter gengyunqii]|uniref:YtxH domain-containing protein n=1 Tax=Arthrobacter gengyunqii TaxID=2886940 RepID=A0A9X1LYV1_9MICC|nr:YtxH domain-containing protein [Arthrobacter gengyunqii]MCC3268283.1 YtxH domain-containing protein [Arthrobacter gengyunqii]UOY95689.1 YtxH domain-containing protein [Arthrobacter gengyunqii]